MFEFDFEETNLNVDLIHSVEREIVSEIRREFPQIDAYLKKYAKNVPYEQWDKLFNFRFYFEKSLSKVCVQFVVYGIPKKWVIEYPTHTETKSMHREIALGELESLKIILSLCDQSRRCFAELVLPAVEEVLEEKLDEMKEYGQITALKDAMEALRVEIEQDSNSI